MRSSANNNGSRRPDPPSRIRIYSHAADEVVVEVRDYDPDDVRFTVLREFRYRRHDPEGYVATMLKATEFAKFARERIAKLGYNPFINNKPKGKKQSG
jgi:hypothetical protein